MCGIFGVVSSKSSELSKSQFSSIVKQLFRLSESRGMESAGVAFDNGELLSTYKQNVSASEFVKHKSYKELINQSFDSENYNTVIAHARMVTHGTSIDNRNNQPVVKDGSVVIHNGIITNSNVLWESNKENIKKEFEVDSEIIPALIRLNLEESSSIYTAAQKLYQEIEGAASIATLFEKSSLMLLGTNTGSLYYAKSATNESLVFASERSILAQLIEKTGAVLGIQEDDVVQLSPGQIVVIDPVTLKIAKCEESYNEFLSFKSLDSKKRIVDFTNYEKIKPSANINLNNNIENYLENNSHKISKVQRCTKCILPSTFPFIRFDGSGVCNYCHNYIKKNKPSSKTELITLLEDFKRKSHKTRKLSADCIVALSGGRDSTYGLHLLKKEFGMKPVTFTYDWGMVTDVARAHMANICGELGVENILVSANIPKKREFIRKNVTAWLKKPDLGIIPLFMAGDKFFFKYVNQVKEQTGIYLDIWSANHYENTDFKTGFCGIPPQFDKKSVDDLGLMGKLQLPTYYLKEFVTNPSYFNSSLVDTIGSYWSYYFEPRKGFLGLYDYVPWVEEEVEDTLINQYGWQPSPETNSTWRIGDGTAAFYNYIYHTVAGFTEFDTFRSNQIREGVISREDALNRVDRENNANKEGIAWYCNVVGLEVKDVLQKINAIKKLY